MTDTDSDETPTDESPDDHTTFSRRGSLSALGLAGLGGLGMLAGPAEARGHGHGHSDHGKAKSWHKDVDANGHDLSDLGSLSMAANDTAITEFAGDNLSIDDGTLNAAGGEDGDRVPETIHYASNYPGDTLDQKIDAIIDEIVASAGHQAGHRIVIAPPDPDDPAAVEDVPAWRFEDPVVIDNNIGKLVFEMSWTLIFATAPIESFFVIGPDEKTENIAMEGGFFYAKGNVSRSFIDIQGGGHLQFYRMYLQSLTGRNSVPAGVRLADKHGSSEITLEDIEVTGCTDGFLAEQLADVPYGAAFDLDIFNWRAGGGEHAIRIDGGVAISLTAIQTGGASGQSISESVVKLENTQNAVRNVSIRHVRERHNQGSFHAGVETVDVDGGPMHEGIYIEDVDCYHAETSTDLAHVTRFDQRNLNPAPAPIEDDSQGTTRWFADDSQRFDSTRGHTFSVNGDPAVEIDGDGFEVVGDGNGPVVTTPDGSSRYRIGVDNDGNLVTEPVSDE